MLRERFKWVKANDGIGGLWTTVNPYTFLKGRKE